MKVKKFDFINPQPKGNPRIMPDITNKKILMGFWHNWSAGNSDGYNLISMHNSFFVVLKKL